MAKIPQIITDFSAGELSPRLKGRPDLPVYSRGMELCENAVPEAAGGVRRVAGTEFNFKVPDPASQGLNKYQPYTLGSLSYWDTSDSEIRESILLAYSDNSQNSYLVLYDYLDDAQTVFTTYVDYGGASSTGFTYFGANHKAVDIISGYDPGNARFSYFITTGSTNPPIAVYHPNGGNWTCKELVDTAKDNWTAGFAPGSAALYQSRLILGDAYNMRVAGSAVGDFEDFDVTGASTDDDAWEFTLDSEHSREVRWLVDQETLIVGADRSESRVQGTGGVPVTRSSAVAREFTRFGATQFSRAALVGDKVLFLQNGTFDLREYLFQNDYQAYQSPSLTAHVDHITDQGIKQFAVQNVPERIVWGVTFDGDLIGMKYAPENQQIAWFRCPKDDSSEYKAVHVSQTEYGERVHFLVYRDQSYYMETLDIAQHEALDSNGAQLGIRGPEDMIYLRHSYVYEKFDGVDNAEIVSMADSGSYVEITFAQPFVPVASQKYRIYGNQRYSDIHDTGQIFELTTTGTYTARTTHTTSITDVFPQKTPGLLSKVYDFSVKSQAQKATVLALNMNDGSDLIAVCDTEILASDGYIDGSGDLRTASDDSLIGVGTYGRTMYFGRYDYKTVIKSMPLVPAIGGGESTQRVAKVEVVFDRTTYAETGEHEDETYYCEGLRPAGIASSEVWYSYSGRIQAIVRGTFFGDEKDEAVVITSDRPAPLAVLRVIATLSASRR